MNLALAVAILAIAGYFGGGLARRIRLPRVTGYLVVGMVLSPSLLGVIPRELIDNQLSIITDVALGIIAYLIGGSLEMKTLRGLKKSIFSITFSQAFATWAIVTLTLVFLFPAVTDQSSTSYLAFAIILGAVSMATAPATTLAIVHEYRAKGPLTTVLLNVVALDDALAIIGYAIAMIIARVLHPDIGAVSWASAFTAPVAEVLGSAALGAVLGFWLVNLSRVVKARQTLLVVVFGSIMLAIGLSKLLGLSALLANMALGFTVANLRGTRQLFGVINDVEDLTFTIFFTFAGCHLDLAVLQMGWILAMVIVASRCTGKYLGTWIGAVVARAPSILRKYLGLCLLPKAGVTVGLILLIRDYPGFEATKSLVVNGILASVIINELLAPPLMKYALFKSGEARTD
ncbi:hypothetical protein AMJ40_03120 [candidate division TA06 bacterium DG_26]|uniref:Cation/H+ exchanger transmembrane domain-containing protein n=1 Tax=candidate division TA06 bacterium DG_26 TaxID=1703771 RepID=A0A0S7WJM8_UNCT6|nr:MAG: hypothetical protein AMJ40_03120 [candidate division TA06 bacterium DG_26]